VTIIKHDFQTGKKAEGTINTKKEKISVYQLRIHIDYSSPIIWRTIQVPGTLKLSALHSILQICFGWNDEATYRFLVGKTFYGPDPTDESRGLFNDSEVQLHELEKVMRFIFSYIYDGGNGWECELTLEEVLPMTETVTHPVLIAAEHASPPNSVADIHEYMEMLSQINELSSVRDKVLAQHDLASTYDPTYFDVNSVNAQLKSIS